MDYLDTSVLIALLLPEPDSTAVRNWLARNEGVELGTSDWAVVEFASAMGIKVRQKALKLREAEAARRMLETLLAESLRIEVPSRAAFAKAAELVAQFRQGLRGGDALHLATALEAGADRFITLDRKLISAARRLKVPLRVLSP
jgi:predicted nucleic acid-binding protein